MYVFFQGIASHKGRRRREGGANRRNGSELRVAGSAGGNSDLLRVTRRKLSCATIGYGGTFICPCDLDLPQCLFSVLCLFISTDYNCLSELVSRPFFHFTNIL